MQEVAAIFALMPADRWLWIGMGAAIFGFLMARAKLSIRHPVVLLMSVAPLIVFAGIFAWFGTFGGPIDLQWFKAGVLLTSPADAIWFVSFWIAFCVARRIHTRKIEPLPPSD